jgi:uncharacterized protein (TIGR03086 family)
LIGRTISPRTIPIVQFQLKGFAMTLVALYTRAVDSFVDKVNGVRPDQWTLPTPCADWDVRQLVNHVVSEQLWSAPMFQGATIADVGDRFDGDLLGEDPRATADGAGQTAKQAVLADGAMGTTVHLSFGDTPADEYVTQLLADHIIHGWDLAVAIDADRTIDSDAVAFLTTWFADREQIYRRAGAVGPRFEVPVGASDQDRLVGAFGRDPTR